MFLAYLVRSSLVRFWVVESGPSQRRLWLGRAEVGTAGPPPGPPPFYPSVVGPSLRSDRSNNRTSSDEPKQDAWNQSEATSAQNGHRAWEAGPVRQLKHNMFICILTRRERSVMRWGGKVWGAIRDSVFFCFSNRNTFFFSTSFIPLGQKSFAGARQAKRGARSHALLTLLYIMALSWIEHEMVRYDSASRAHCSAALRLHMERGLTAGLALDFEGFLWLVFFTRFIAAGVQDQSTVNVKVTIRYLLSCWKLRMFQHKHTHTQRTTESPDPFGLYVFLIYRRTLRLAALFLE